MVLRSKRPLNNCSSYSGFLDNIKCELDRFSENRHESGTGELPTSFDINVKNVSFAYDDRGPVLRQVSFYLPSGQFWG
jgi:ABC-type multidrug transport system fused ATPase/permease subunit